MRTKRSGEATTCRPEEVEMKTFGDARDSFFEHRFGLFIHWGPYAIPAIHEQVLWRYAGQFPRSEYERLMQEFDPQAYDPGEWTALARRVGMQYLCFTTKHHDGFCMWDSAQTDYKITNTPYGKDTLAMLSEACSRDGIKLSLYYSLPDWHHPTYPNRGRHHEMRGPRPGDEPDERAYLGYVRDQISELLNGYGPIYQLFWDVNVAEFHDPSLNELARRLQPGILINNRGPGEGDYSTPERHVPEGGAFAVPTEACQSMGRESWGYREDEDYYRPAFLMGSIDRTLAMGGNYLLNVGPKPDGTLPQECVEGLTEIGDWYARVRAGFDGTTPCTYMVTAPETEMFRYDQIFLTRRGNTFYVHCPEPLQTGTIVLPGFDTHPEKITLLNDGSPLDSRVDIIPWRWTQRPCLRIVGLPRSALSGEPLVVEMEFGEQFAV